MPPKLAIDISALSERPDITQGGTVHVGSVVVSATGVTSNGMTQSLNPSDLCFAEAGCLGRGSSGSVLKVLRKSDDKFIALKEIKVSSQSHLQEIERELRILHADVSPSPFLVGFHGAYSQEGSVFIAMDCMDGSLEGLRPVSSIEILARITRSILSGLSYLHKERHLVHRDLKPGNILYNNKGEVKVSDFGVSTMLENSRDNTQSFVGTVSYMSPERLRGESYSYAADVWSLGIVVSELYLGNHPFAAILPDGQGSEGRFWALLQHLSGDSALSIFPPDANPMLVDFVDCCLRKAPQNRSSSTDLLQHFFITMCARGTDEENQMVIQEWLASKAPGQVNGDDAKVNINDALGRLAQLGKK
jgi:serine/threonine protein kinase